MFKSREVLCILQTRMKNKNSVDLIPCEIFYRKTLACTYAFFNLSMDKNQKFIYNSLQLRRTLA